MDAAGSAIVTGTTRGQGFPVTPNAFQRTPGTGCGTQPLISPGGDDAFVAKLSPDGVSLVYSTLLGGTCGESGNAVALDAGGNVWVGGLTFSRDFPVTPDALQPKFAGPAYDSAGGFLARFDGQGNLTYSTYLGGDGNSTSVDALTLDAAGNLFLTGLTTGLSQPASPGAFQSQAEGGCPMGFGPPVFQVLGSAFVMKLDPSAGRVAGLTYVGSFCDATIGSIAVNPSGAVWIAGNIGTPLAASLPTVRPLGTQGYGFVSQFSADLKRLLFSTPFDTANGLVLDADGVASVVGAATAADTGAQQAYLAAIELVAPVRRPPMKRR